MAWRPEGPEPEGDSAVQALAAGLKRYTSARLPAAGGEGRAHVRLHPHARALRAAAGALWRQARRAAGRSQACQARPSCMLGADPGRAPRLPDDAEGQDAAAEAGGGRIVLRLRLTALINGVLAKSYEIDIWDIAHFRRYPNA
jgi:hypothetical protein